MVHALLLPAMRLTIERKFIHSAKHSIKNTPRILHSDVQEKGKNFKVRSKFHQAGGRIDGPDKVHHKAKRTFDKYALKDKDFTEEKRNYADFNTLAFEKRPTLMRSSHLPRSQPRKEKKSTVQRRGADIDTSFSKTTFNPFKIPWTRGQSVFKKDPKKEFIERSKNADINTLLFKKHSAKSHKSPWKKERSYLRKSPNLLESVPSRFRLSEASKLQLMDYKSKGRWTDILANEQLQDALSAMGISTPNPMQLAVIPRIAVSASSVLCAAETGSGKTLAYLLPIIEKLKDEEKADPGIRSNAAQPRALILVPSNELVNQVHSVAKFISHHVKLRVEKISGALRREAREDALAGPIDLVISTPAQLLNSAISLQSLRHLVIDEGDSLLSDDFGEQIKVILSGDEAQAGEVGAMGGDAGKVQLEMNVNNQPAVAPDAERLPSIPSAAHKRTGLNLNTTVICSATIPISLTRHLDELFPGIIRLGSPRLHTASDRVDVRFVDVQRPGNAKLQTCEELLTKNYQKTTLIFCNTMAHACKVHQMMAENEQLMETLTSVPSLLHGAIPERQRQAIIKRFQSGDIKYLVCTDLASRGLDTTNVGHVIMYDFARNTIDFIHRAGRTGRLIGSRGLVSCLISARDEALAKAIKQSIKSNQSLTSPR